MESSSPGTATPRRRRPRKGDLKERAILERAERLLAEKPLSDIAIDELARAAGISRPAFYFYFESKDAVLQSLVERIGEAAYAASERWHSYAGEPPEESIREAIAASARLWQEHGPVLRAAVQAWETAPDANRFWEDIVSRFVDASATRIRRERRSGLAPDDGPSAKALATALIWMNERCFYTASLGADPTLGERELVATLTTIWLRAVYGSERPSQNGRR
jgi:AcrR family transcriptional regulator